jgi:hypothetical protein
MQITNQYTAVAMQRAMLQDPVLSQLMGLTQPGQQQPQQSNASGEVNKRKMNEQKPPQGKASQM